MAVNSTLGESILTMFRLLTTDQWDSMSQEIIEVSDPTLTYIFFISWVWLGAFIFKNVFIGVIGTHLLRH
jgi:cation channel sperm-associated protein 2